MTKNAAVMQGAVSVSTLVEQMLKAVHPGVMPSSDLRIALKKEGFSDSSIKNGLYRLTSKGIAKTADGIYSLVSSSVKPVPTKPVTALAPKTASAAKPTVASSVAEKFKLGSSKLAVSKLAASSVATEFKPVSAQSIIGNNLDKQASALLDDDELDALQQVNSQPDDADLPAEQQALLDSIELFNRPPIGIDNVGFKTQALTQIGLGMPDDVQHLLEQICDDLRSNAA